MQAALRGGAAQPHQGAAPLLHRGSAVNARAVRGAPLAAPKRRSEGGAPSSPGVPISSILPRAHPHDATRSSTPSSSRSGTPSPARRRTPTSRTTTADGLEAQMELMTQTTAVTRSSVEGSHAQQQVPGLAWWDALPSRYKLLVATSFSFVLCNMDKVNMSVAIIPMALDFGWSPSVSGVVQASFFYGYMLSQLPGGYLAGTLGGRRVLPGGVALWSGMTCAVPLLATTIPGLCVARAGVGLGEAVAPSAATDMIARVVPPAERSRAVSFVFGGLHVGSITGLLAAPALIHAFGWQSVFVVFGAAGLLWVGWFEGLVASLRQRDPAFVDRLQLGGTDWANSPDSSSAASTSSSSLAASMASSSIADSIAVVAVAPQHAQHDDAGGHHGSGPLDANMTIPYRAFLRSPPVMALCFTHLCHNWFHYTMLAWLPTYFTSTLSVDLTHAAQTALFPPLAGILASATAGPLADGLIGRGLPTPVVRKLVQGLSFLGPCAFLLAAGSDAVAGDRTLTVACITAALGMSSLSLGGLYCTHQDMSPKYASALLGLSNTVGAIPGIVGVAIVGFLLDETNSWYDALFLPSAVCMVAGAYTYTVHARNHPIDFDAMDNSPFAFERFLPKPPAWLRLPGFGGGPAKAPAGGAQATTTNSSGIKAHEDRDD